MSNAEPNAASQVMELPVDLDITAETAAALTGQDEVDSLEMLANIPTADPSAPTARVVPAHQESSGNGSVVTRTAPPGLPIPVLLRSVSGRYRSGGGTGFRLELRVDVDGRRPLGRLSGDYFSISGATTSYFGSWTVDAVTITVTPATIRIVGTARTTWTTTFTVATVTIPRTTIFQPPAPASIRWSTPSGAVGATYVCVRESPAFRTVELEQDREAGVTPFSAYDTGSLPSGGPARSLTVPAAYGEAGVQVLDTGGANIINTPPGHIWNNASLHHAMQTQFSRWRETPQFKVWLLHAMRHELGVGLRGIMFDQQGLQRQGCASFYQAISTGTPANLREQLYVNIHELGHCFNLFHSFHKSFMTPPLPNRPGSLSWMNYPRFYAPASGAPGGEAAFWAAFPFQFDDLELAHVRHGFRNAVIMGGNPFGTGAAFDAGEAFADSLSDTSGLELQISADNERPVLGTPVVLNINLIAQRPQLVHRREQLHPKFEFVQVAVTRPRGDTIIHKPPVTHCVDPDLLRSADGAVQPISAYIGYDARAGQVFEDPGTYRVRAAYASVDGTVIVSNVLSLRVASPRDEHDEQVADLMLTDDVGLVLTLLGTDSPYLSNGTDALEKVVEEHPKHPSAVYAKMALGINAARPFTTVEPDGTANIRERDLSRADSLLQSAVAESRGSGGLDDLTVYQVLGYLADSHDAEGDTTTARQLRAEGAEIAQAKRAPASVANSFLE